MIEDVRTVVWKETREIIAMQGTARGGIIRYALSFGLMGVYMPYCIGRPLVDVPYLMLVYVWVSMFMGIGIVLDSFAGERERHTLETLLASRLSDRAILFGKITSAVLYGFGMTLAMILLGLLTVNVAFWNGQIALYPPEAFALVIVAVLLVNVFFTAIGVLVSLRAQTVRQGSETLMAAIIGIAAVPVILYLVLPDDWKSKLLDAAASAGTTGLAIGAIALLAVVTAVTLYAATLSFRRDKLILD